MSDFNSEWIKKWGLSRGDFKGMPQGGDPLVWALQNRKVEETAYVQWAGNHYRLPVIQRDFFNKSVNFDLLEKFKDLHPWSSHCYPVQIWKGNLLIACLEPPKLRTDSKISFAIAPFLAMNKAWRDYHEKQEVTQPFSSIMDFDFSSLDTDASKENTSVPTSEGRSSSLHNSDEFSPSAASPVRKSVQKKETPVSVSEIDVDFSSLEEKSVTDSHSHRTRPNREQKPGTPYTHGTEAMTQQKSGVSQTQKTEAVNQKKPGQSIHGFQKPDIFHSPHSKVTHLHKKNSFQNKTDSFQKTKYRINKKSNDNKEKTVHSQILSKKSKFIITDQDLSRATDINNCHNIKEVLSCIFYYLKDDYKKLMFVECVANDQYLPHFIYGNWHITDLAWKTPVNITNPNIFRIVYNSKLPFHGAVVDNDFNRRYYQWWTNNQKPDFATIYPFYYNQFLYGFLVCFEKTSEFEQNITLKKIENLLAISKTQFMNMYKSSKTSP